MKLSAKQFISKLEDYLDSGRVDAKVTKVLLAIIALAAIGGIAATAPNIFILFKKRKSFVSLSNKRYQNTLMILKRSRYIRRDSMGMIHVTPKGNKQLHAIILEDISIAEPKKWDGKWRLFLFDIPIRFKKGRDALRWKIKDLGFIQFQKSVWIYPYPCEEEINLVASYFGVTKHVDLFTVHNLPREQEFKKKFGL